MTNRSKYNTGVDKENRNLSGSPYTGSHRFHERVLRKLNPQRNIKCVYVCVEDMVDYDLVNMKTKINTESLSKLKFLTESENNSYIEDLATFSKWILDTDSTKKADIIQGSKSDQLEKEFRSLLCDFFELRHSNYGRVLSATDTHLANIKATLMKLKLIWESMSEERRTQIDTYVQKMEHSDFHGLLLKIRNALDKENPAITTKLDSKIDKSWMGVRFGIEVPNSKGHRSQPKKNLGVEMLNKHFMWCDDYFHYDDWSKKMKEAYDGFNLWVKTPEDLFADEKYFYQDGWKRTPKGIFPDGKGVRELALPNVKDDYKQLFLSKLDLIKHKNMNPSIAVENKAMVVEELLRNRDPVSNEIRMITNLQNVKNSLKKTKSHNEILSFIAGFNFTDSLISDHLSALDSAEASDKSQKKAKLLPRDASSFREFYRKIEGVKDRHDPFTNFYLKEAEFHQMTREILPDKIKKARNKEEKEAYQEILDNMLLTEMSREESDLNVGSHVIKRDQVHYNFDSLIKDIENYDKDPEVHSGEYSDEMFLDRKRRQAEANIIKTKILYKLHEDLKLTSNEKAYLKRWNEELKSSRYKNLNE